MSVTKISAVEALQHLHEFDAVIDARSEAEHAEDHLPGAINWPSLDNDERMRVGTLYKQVNQFEAKKRGAKSVVRREVIRLVTPGTLTEETLLDARRQFYAVRIESVSAQADYAKALAAKRSATALTSD